MSGPIDLVLSRIDTRPNGRDRWRCACPVCGEGNQSTLSIGIGDTGAVLLKCWKSGCSPEQIAAAIGLDITDLFPPKRDAGQGYGAMRRRRLLTASQALELLENEIGLTRLCASDMARGAVLDDVTRERLMVAAARVSVMRDEVNA